MITQQQQTVQILNEMVALVPAISQLQINLTDVINRQTIKTAVANAANLPTCAQNADGSLGAADGTANTAHPIDTRVVTGLNYAVTQTQYSALNTALVNLLAAINNSNVQTGIIPVLNV